MAMTLDGTLGAFLPTWTTGTRPASPANGQIGYNSTTGQIDQYVGSAWSSVPTSSASQATATALGTVYAKQTTGGGTPYLTAFGYNAGVSTTGATCTAIGTQALFSNTSGNQNTAVGYQALYSNSLSTGVSLTAVGWQAGYSYNSSGSNQAQVFIGASAGYYNVSGIDNSYVGGYAGYYQTGGYNTALGSGALLGASGTSTGSNNTAVGYNALKASTTGDSNCCVGENSGLSINTGNNNTFFGTASGNGGFGAQAFTTGSYNVSVGFTTGASSGSVSNSVVISSGYAAVDKGTSTAYINGNTGGTYNGANTTTFATTSDRRLKKNIVDNNVGLDKIVQIQVRNFEYRTEDEITELPKNQAIKKQGVQLGVIAQELQQALPDCVKQESTGVLSVDSDNLVWHLINAVKELSAEVNALKAKVGA